PGEIGPFSLVSYEDAARRGAKILEVTASRYMPPWQPAHNVGVFAGERRLSDDEIALIHRWVDQGMPRGDPARMPALPRFADGGRGMVLPEGLALPLPAGTDFLLQMHFHSTGDAVRERAKVGLYFAPGPPGKALASLELPALFGFGAGIDIPAGESQYVIRD